MRERGEEKFFKGSALWRLYLPRGPICFLNWVEPVWVAGGGSVLFHLGGSEGVVGFKGRGFDMGGWGRLTRVIVTS